MSQENFYLEIPFFSDFSQFTDDRHFRRVPSDWHVVLTDVKGSTKAIENGRYKDVNRVGAAAIACAQKGMEGLEFPYVFGGDGATLVVPPGRLEAVSRELTALQALSQKRFGLGLRVGAVPISELEAAGAMLEVARFEVAEGRCIAIFRGGALALAEKLIKGDEARYAVSQAMGSTDGMDELSCRWNVVPSSRGRIVSLMVLARSGDHSATYREVLEGLGHIVEHGLDAANPIQVAAMSYRTWWNCVRDEARHFPSIFSTAFFKKLLGITVSVASLRYRIKPYFYDPKAYTQSIPAHCDYRKFDDTLRMIIDCEEAQVAKLNAFLEGFYRQGRIFYGMRVSDSSLITCYVQSTEPGGHIHFVDGGDGGYALAAKQMKAQMNAPILFNDSAGYERYMGVWSQSVGQRFLEWLAAPQALRWLDVGCGSGAFTELVAQVCGPSGFEGVDPSQAQVKFAASRPSLAGGRFQVGDAMALPYPQASFDVAVMPLVIFFVPDPAKGVAEMVRVLRPGGWACAYAWDMPGGGFPYALLMDELDAMGLQVPRTPHPESSRLETLKELWEGAGLEAVETKTLKVQRTFKNLDEYWETVQGAPSMGAIIRSLSQEQAKQLRAKLSQLLKPAADGRMVCEARANAVKGRRP